MRTIIFLLACGLVAAQPSAVIDTVGGTTFDNQNSGPALQWVGYVPGAGIHVSWTYSARPYGSNWPDRTKNYNFFDLSRGSWNWLDPNFMNSGMNCQTRRTGYGTLEVSPQDGVALIGAHYNAGGMPPQFAPVVVRDLMPGAGIFDESPGAPTLTGYFLPALAMTPDLSLHLLIIKFAVEDNLYYARSTSWPEWESPVGWSQTGAFGHNIFASTSSSRLLATWMTGGGDNLGLYYRLSTDGGSSWSQVTRLDAPDAFGPDTMTVCNRGASALFDADGNWLLVTTISPSVADTVRPNPAELWMYNSGTSSWHKIHRGQSHALAGGFGSHASICDRPSLGRNPETGRLFVAWEEFDSTNVEPSTNLLRADIWLASSEDGALWSEPARLTEPDQSSKRFPSLARNCTGDSLAVGFIQDVIAGFNSDSIGMVSNNPVCVWRGTASGIAEERQARISPRPNLTAAPSPFRATTTLRLRPAPNGTKLSIFSADGRLIRSLGPDVQTTTGLFVWDGRDKAGQRLKPGCYFASYYGARAKLVLTR